MADKLIHEDIRALGYCNRGAREFFENQGWSWSDFRENGLDFSILEQVDDQMVTDALAHARKRIEGEQS